VRPSPLGRLSRYGPWIVFLFAIILALPRTGPGTVLWDFLTRDGPTDRWVHDPYGRGYFGIQHCQVLMNDYVTIEHRPEYAIGWTETILEITEAGDVMPGFVSVRPTENGVVVEVSTQKDYSIFIPPDEISRLRWFGPRLIDEGHPLPLSWSWLDATDSAILLVILGVWVLRNRRRCQMPRLVGAPIACGNRYIAARAVRSDHHTGGTTWNDVIVFDARDRRGYRIGPMLRATLDQILDVAYDDGELTVSTTIVKRRRPPRRQAGLNELEIRLVVKYRSRAADLPAVMDGSTESD